MPPLLDDAALFIYMQCTVIVTPNHINNVEGSQDVSITCSNSELLCVMQYTQSQRDVFVLLPREYTVPAAH